MSRINRILLIYLSALAFLLVSVATSMVLTEMQASRLEADAKDINVSGRQRMLSQRIIYLAQDLMTSVGDEAATTRAALLEAIAEFEAMIVTFEQSHLALSQRPDLDPALRHLYFWQSEGASLDQRIRDYTRYARQIAADPADADSLRALKSIERQGLLRDLDAVVSRIEATSVARVGALRNFERYSLILAAVIVLAEVLLVFLPGHRFIKDTLRSLQDQNAKLDDTRAALFAQNEELRDKNAQIAADSESLRAAWRESEALRQEQADFTYSVSHDLKSPTNTIHLLLNELSLAHAETLGEDSRELLDLALDTVRRMGVQIEDVLQYSAATDEPAQPVIVEMKGCIDNVLANMRSDLAGCGAVVDVSASGAVFGHATQLRIMVQNLVGNAIKFQPEGGQPVVSVTCVNLPDQSGVMLAVADNGIGIPPESHERIFGLFQRLHVRETYPGTGLGLATCQRIALNHGGQIMVSSAPGEGSRFEVVLHAARPKGAEDNIVLAA